MAKKDTRIPFGARCTWWDSIDKIGVRFTPGGFKLPCCPHCGGMLYEMKDEAEWFASVDKYEAAGNPGYRVLVEWLRGKCFPNYAVARTAFEAREIH